MRFLLILFIVMPIIEIWLLIVVGQHLGASLTIMVVFTAVIGLHGLRSQGLSTIKRLRTSYLPSSCLPERLLKALFWQLAGAFADSRLYY